MKRTSSGNWSFLYQKLNIEEEVHHIPVLNNVIFTLRTHFSCFLSSLFTLVGDVIIKADRLSANKATFKVGMNDTSSLRCGVAFVNCPRTNFFYASCKVSL